MAGATQIFDGLLGVATLTIMVCQVTVVVGQAVMVEQLYHPPRPFMQGLPLFFQRCAISNVLGQRMLEEVLRFLECRLFIQKLFGLQRR